VDPVFLDILGDVSRRLDRFGIDYGIFGGVASSALGRPRATRDIDVFLRPERADAALDHLARAGYETDRLDEKWIYKAQKDGVVVDVIFSTRYGIYLDDEMSTRTRQANYEGVPIRTIGAEDLLIIKAVACDEASPKHWYDALGLIVENDLDWEYLRRRAVRAQRRVLSLLFYAQSIDYFIPEEVMRSMTKRLFSERAGSDD
jgi:predicted nucleotidyltransferase